MRRQPNGWQATNTDVDGFLEPLDAALGSCSALQGLRVSVLGAGGAARAVIVALASRKARVTVHARRPEQAAEVATDLGANVDLVGPGPAYERFKQTPDYQQWLKDTGRSAVQSP